MHRGAWSYRRTASRPASDGFVFGASRPPRLTEVSERREHSGRDDPVESLSRPTSERRSRRLTPVVVIRLPSPRIPTRILALVRASPPDRPCPRGLWPLGRAARALCAIRVVEGVAALCVTASPRAATVPRAPVGSRRGATPTSVIVSFSRRVPRARPAPFTSERRKRPRHSGEPTYRFRLRSPRCLSASRPWRVFHSRLFRARPFWRRSTTRRSPTWRCSTS